MYDVTAESPGNMTMTCLVAYVSGNIVTLLLGLLVSRMAVGPDGRV
jgi:hypothetical protein